MRNNLWSISGRRSQGFDVFAISDRMIRRGNKWRKDTALVEAGIALLAYPAKNGASESLPSGTTLDDAGKKMECSVRSANHEIIADRSGGHPLGLAASRAVPQRWDLRRQCAPRPALTGFSAGAHQFWRLGWHSRPVKQALPPTHVAIRRSPKLNGLLHMILFLSSSARYGRSWCEIYGTDARRSLIHAYNTTGPGIITSCS